MRGPETSEDAISAALVPCARFTTAAIPPEDRFDAWRQFLGSTHDIEAEDARDFSGSVVTTAIDRMVARVMSADRQAVQRSPRRCSRDGFDHVTLHLTTTRFDVETSTSSFHVPVGAITVNTLARPFRRSAAPERAALVVSLARNLVTEHIADPEAAHGSVLQGTAAAVILSTHMTALCEQMREVRMSEAAALAEGTAQLLAAALASTRSSREIAGPAAQAAILVRCKTFVASHLRSPDLSPDSICRGVGISRAGLYRLFQPSGGAANYIREERLRAVRNTIARSPVRPRIADLAYSYGFTNVSAFNRMFRSAFGISPTEVRRLDAETPPVPHIYREWLRTFG